MGEHYCKSNERFVFVVFQSLSHIWLFVTPCTAAHNTPLSFNISQSFLKFMFIELVVQSNHLILYYHLLILPSIFPSIKDFSNKLAICCRISPSNECSGLISFLIDWFDLLIVQWSLKSIFQHHNSKASILPCSVFFMVQISHQYMTTGKTIALTTWTFLCKVVSTF